MQEFETRRFTEEEQGEVLRLAARLQREQGATISGRDLIQIATEAGIDRTFVLQALELREQTATPEPQEQLWPIEASPRETVGIPLIVKGLIPALLLTQCFWLFTGYSFYMPMPLLRLGLTATLTAAIAACLWRTPRSRRISAAIVAGSLFCPALFATFYRVFCGLMGPGWLMLITELAVVQLLATGSGWFIGFASEVLKPSTSKPRPTT